MKRRLPSKITQEKDISQNDNNVTEQKGVTALTQPDQHSTQADATATQNTTPSTAKDDETAIAMAELDALLSKPQAMPENVKKNASSASDDKPTEEYSNNSTTQTSATPSSEEVVASGQGKGDYTQPKGENATATPEREPSKPSHSMKRRLGGNKGTKDILKPSAKGGPMAQSGKPQEEKKLAIAEDDDTGKRSVREDADQATTTAVDDIQGNIVHPADMETEAAYISLEDDVHQSTSARASATDRAMSSLLQKEKQASSDEEKSTSHAEKASEDQPLKPSVDKVSSAAFTAPPSYGELATTPEVTPEEGDGGWDLGSADSAATFSGDVYSTLMAEDPLEEAQTSGPGINAATEQPAQSEKPASGAQFPWLQNSADGAADNAKASKAPELPHFVASASKKGFSPIPLIILLVVGGGIFFGIKLLMGDDETQERMARASQSLTEVTEKIPTSMGGVQDIENPSLIQPEDVITPDEYAQQDMQQQLEEWANADPIPPLDGSSSTQSNIQIDFVDVDAAEADEPIIADDDDLPDDISALAKLQRAIAKERERREKERTSATATSVDQTTKTKTGELTPEQKLSEIERSEQLKQQLQADLDAYKAALANIEEPALRPKPNEFFEDPEKYLALAGNPVVDNVTRKSKNGDLLPPAELGAQDLPASVLYNENPYNLPVIPEPELNPEVPVRTLDDFPEAMFESSKPRVKIPQGVRPSLRTSEFPQVALLSLVPDRGIVALHKGREGVLLVGENIEGWELVGVYSDYAEFRSAGRKHLLTIPQ